MTEDTGRRRGGRVSHIREVLVPALERLGPKGVWTESRIRKMWTEVVGTELAGHARIIRLRGQSLVVGTSSDAWATELRYLSAEVVDKLNRGLGDEVVCELIVTRRRDPKPGW